MMELEMITHLPLLSHLYTLLLSHLYTGSLSSDRTGGEGSDLQVPYLWFR